MFSGYSPEDRKDSCREMVFHKASTIECWRFFGLICTAKYPITVPTFDVLFDWKQGLTVQNTLDIASAKPDLDVVLDKVDTDGLSVQSFCTTAEVVNVPEKGSRTTSPGLLLANIIRSSRDSGFCVGWSSYSCIR